MTKEQKQLINEVLESHKVSYWDLEHGVHIDDFVGYDVFIQICNCLLQDAFNKQFSEWFMRCMKNDYVGGNGTR